MTTTEETKETKIIAKVREAVAELDAEHRPQWVSHGTLGYTTEPQFHHDPIGCVICFPHDGSWPCASRMIADDLREIL